MWENCATERKWEYDKKKGIFMTFSIIYPKDIEHMRQEKHAVLVDVRSREEFQKGHWQGAMNFPEEEIADYSRVLRKGRFYIIYCQHGGSRMQVARTLGKMEYSVGTVIGGYEAMKKIKENYFKNQ